MKKHTLSLDTLHSLSQELLAKFPQGVVILRGDLAAGKTTLVQNIVACLGIDVAVTSPTFSLQQVYGEKVFHYDMYNHGLEHFISLGMLEELDKSGLHFVEWGDDALRAILESAGIDNITIDIEKISKDLREYRIEYA